MKIHIDKFLKINFDYLELNFLCKVTYRKAMYALDELQN